MTYVPITPLPGVCKVSSPFSLSSESGYSSSKVATGRFTDMDGVRFEAGLPEKIGGWTTALGTAIPGTPRGLRDWRDFSQNTYLGIGTNSKLVYLLNGALTDITPWRSILTGTLTNALDTSINSTTITVHHTAHGLSTGDYIKLVAGTAIGGITPAGVFNPITKSDANTYTFVNTNAATSNATNGGGTISYTYYRITIANSLSTIIGTPTVTVTHTTHGAIVGDYVTITGTTAIGGITPTGEVKVASVIDANNWTFTWTSNATSTVNAAGGSPNYQYDINVGLVDAATTSGYSNGGYSNNGYSQSGSIGITTPPRVWALARYGQQLYACPINGTIYVFDPTVGGRAAPLYNAPATCLWMFITPERFVFALGTSGLLTQVQWPDQSDSTNWTAAINNTANTRNLQDGSFLVGGISPRDGVSLVFTNTSVYTFSYSGDAFIYNSSLASHGANLIGPLAVATKDGIAYWMSDDEFYMWNGTVQPLPTNDIRDFVFLNLNKAQAYKNCAGTNISKKEIVFFYVSSASSEIDRYAVFNTDQNCWSTGGVLKRTSWIDRDLFSTPIAVDASGYIYNQESGTDANGAQLDSYVVFNPTAIANGERQMDVSSFFVDFERQSGAVNLTVNAQTYPQDPITSFGPYSIMADDSTPRIDLRVGAKLIGFKLESNVVGGDWRLGMPTVEAQIAGARR